MPEKLLDYSTFSGIRDDLAEYAKSRLNVSSNSEKIFQEVYIKDLETGVRETIPQRMAAIAVDIASADMKYFQKDMPQEEKINRVKERAKKNLELYVTNTFRANTPTNINMGRWRAEYDEDGNLDGNYKQPSQLGSACFVIPIEDTFGNNVNDLQDGILEAWLTQQMVHKGGGGTGFSFQRLRPKGSKIGYNPAVDGMESISWEAGRGMSSGAESFLEHYFNASTDAVKQGNSRRGANMGIQRIDHMDFLDHLFAKFGKDKYRSEFRMKNFNLSLAVTDEFMESAIKGNTYTLINPHRAQPKIKRVLEKKFGVKNPEIVRKGDIATRKQFEKILEMNKANSFNPVTTPSLYLDDDGKTLVNAYNGQSIGLIVDDEVRIDARTVLDLMAKLSHTNGEPGIMCLDRVNEFNANLYDNEDEATNPCGEQPLPPYDACNLGSINAGKFSRYQVYDSEDHIGLEKKILSDKFTKIEKRRDGKVGVMWFDWNSYKETIHEGVHFLDNVIERSDFPALKIKKAVEENRNIGLGLMGAYDAMVLMKMKYGREDSFEFAEELAKVLHEESLKASQELAKERGAYPLYETSHHNPDSDLYKWLMSNPKTIPDRFKGERKLSGHVNREKVMTYGGGPVRNAAINTEAPTGTIRRSAGEKYQKLSLDNLAISSGIEPIFALIEHSKILNSNVYDTSSAAVNLLEREGLDVRKTLSAIEKNKGSVFVYSHTPEDAAKILNEIPEDVKDVLVTASGGEGDRYEISYDQHIEMLSRFQKYNDSATSKTINLPNGATVDMMKDAWIRIWKSGAKGGTVYRDNSREYQILNVTMKETQDEKTKSKRRPLLQKSVTIELPYISSVPGEGRGDIDFNPDRVFTTIAYNPINGGITGIFQNLPELDIERLSSLIELNIDKSRSFKQGRRIDEVIEDLEKISIRGAQRGVVVDEAVMANGSKERKRFEVNGASTGEARLNSLYIMRYLTKDGTDFNDTSIKERLDKYFMGDISLKSIINTRGKLKLEEGGSRPSILPNGKVVKLPEEIGAECPECK